MGVVMTAEDAPASLTHRAPVGSLGPRSDRICRGVLEGNGEAVDLRGRRSARGTGVPVRRIRSVARSIQCRLQLGGARLGRGGGGHCVAAHILQCGRELT